MPLPRPRRDESKRDFIDRCMGNATMVREFGDPSQRRAVCESQWEQGEARAAMKKLIRLKAETGEIRTASFRGVEHLVVPVVALVEGVIHASNASAPALVLASEFGHAVAGWNGRPVMAGHPKRDGQPISANDPKTLERAIGQTFGATVEDRKLKLEAWIDVAKAKELGGAEAAIAERLERFQAGEETTPIEISVGVFVDEEPQVGQRGGQRYAAVWRRLVPDHLAFLGEGEVGACSVSMGCGAPRVGEGETARTLWQRLAALFGFRTAITDSDLRHAVELALQDADPNYLGLFAIEDGRFAVYHAFAPGGGGVRMYRRAFTHMASGEIRFKGEVEEVRPETTFIPMEEGGSMEKTQRVANLIAAGAFTEADKPWLMSMTDEQLGKIAALRSTQAPPAAPSGQSTPCQQQPRTACAGAEGQGAPVQGQGSGQPPAQQQPGQSPAPAAAAAPRAKTEEEWLAEAPESIRAMVARQRAAEAERKTELVSALKGVQNAYTEEELKALPLEQLERLAKAVKVPAVAAGVDFSQRGAPRVEDSDTIPSPPDLIAAIRAKGSGTQQSATA